MACYIVRCWKLLTVLGRACNEYEIGGWRQSNSKDEARRAAKRRQINAAYEDYLSKKARAFLSKVKATIETLTQAGHVVTITALQDTIRPAVRQVDPIERRVLKGDVIPPKENIISIFEEHSEGISKRFSSRHQQ